MTHTTIKKARLLFDLFEALEAFENDLKKWTISAILYPEMEGRARQVASITWHLGAFYKAISRSYGADLDVSSLREAVSAATGTHPYNDYKPMPSSKAAALRIAMLDFDNYCCASCCE